MVADGLTSTEQSGAKLEVYKAGYARKVIRHYQPLSASGEKPK